MPEFRKKPVVIEAVQFLGMFVGQKRDSCDIPDSFFSDYPPWLQDAWNGGRGPLSIESQTAARKEDWRGWVEIKTLEGVMRADPGDWIIRGVKGELYPCKPDIFEATYEAVS